MKEKGSLKYCSIDFFKRTSIIRVAFILVLLIVLWILAKQRTISLLLMLIALVTLPAVFFTAVYLRLKKEFETILISEDQIRICMPGKMPIDIPWSESVCIDTYPLVGKMLRQMEFDERNWRELILSSEKISSGFQVDSFQHFSPEKYDETGSWRVSLGRGSKKWYRKQIAAIEEIKQRALSVSGSSKDATEQ